jgi:hypothetical protein
MPKPKNHQAMITKRRQQLTRQLVLEMMDKKKDSKNDATPGLLSKMMTKLDQDLDSTDEDLRHKTMDKIIKLLPFVIAKEKAPAVQLNVQNNNGMGSPQISAGKTTSLAIGTMQDYLKNREVQKKMKTLPPIEEAEVVEEIKNTNSKTTIMSSTVERDEPDFEEEEED